MAALPLLALAGTAMGAVGQMGQADATAASQEANAKAQQMAAGEARAQGDYAGEQEKQKADYLLSDQKAKFAASGGGTDGSALTVTGKTAGKGLFNQEMQVWQGEEKARGHDYQGQIDQASADATRSAEPWMVGSSILTGISKAGSQGGFGKTGSWFDSPTSNSPYRYG